MSSNSAFMVKKPYPTIITTGGMCKTMSEKDMMNKKIDILREKNKLLEDRISQLEALVQEMYFSAEMRGPGFIEAQKSFQNATEDENVR